MPANSAEKDAARIERTITRPSYAGDENRLKTAGSSACIPLPVQARTRRPMNVPMHDRIRL